MNTFFVFHRFMKDAASSKAIMQQWLTQILSFIAGYRGAGVHTPVWGKDRGVHFFVDDAYTDMWEIARPVFQARGIRPCLAVPVEPIAGDGWLWYDRIRERLIAHMPVDVTLQERDARVQTERDVTDIIRFVARLPWLQQQRCENELLGQLPAVACERERRLLTITAIKKLSTAGWEIASHSLRHRLLSTLPYKEKLREIAESKEIIEHWTQRPCRNFVYPVGSRESFDRETVDMVKKCGYTRAFTTQKGVYRGTADQYQIPRIGINPGESRVRLTGKWLLGFCHGG